MSFWRRVVTFLSVTAAVLTATTVGARALFMRQASVARQRIGKPLGEQSIDADRVWRRSYEGEPVELLLLGDSLAAGLGADRRKQTLGGRIAKGLARELQRPVRLTTAAVVGSESSALAGQIDSLPGHYRAHVSVIVVGGNDVTHLVPPAQAARHLSEAIDRLRARGIPVVVGTCPDLGSLQPVPQPLRSYLSAMSRRMANAQTRAARRAGAVTVNLRALVGPVFRAEPGVMFSVDQFHPGPAGYRRTADALLPHVVELAITSGDALQQPGDNREDEENETDPQEKIHGLDETTNDGEDNSDNDDDEK